MENISDIKNDLAYCHLIGNNYKQMLQKLTAIQNTAQAGSFYTFSCVTAAIQILRNELIEIEENNKYLVGLLQRYYSNIDIIDNVRKQAIKFAILKMFDIKPAIISIRRTAADIVNNVDSSLLNITNEMSNITIEMSIDVNALDDKKVNKSIAVGFGGGHIKTNPTLAVTAQPYKFIEKKEEKPAPFKLKMSKELHQKLIKMKKDRTRNVLHAVGPPTKSENDLQLKRKLRAKVKGLPAQRCSARLKNMVLEHGTGLNKPKMINKVEQEKENFMQMVGLMSNNKKQSCAVRGHSAAAAAPNIGTITNMKMREVRIKLKRVKIDKDGLVPVENNVPNRNVPLIGEQNQVHRMNQKRTEILKTRLAHLNDDINILELRNAACVKEIQILKMQAQRLLTRVLAVINAMPA